MASGVSYKKLIVIPFANELQSLRKVKEVNEE